MKKIILFASILSLFSCTNEQHCKEVLIEKGYTPIETGGYTSIGVKGDGTRTRFKALDCDGRTVTGCVTTGCTGTKLIIDVKSY